MAINYKKRHQSRVTATKSLYSWIASNNNPMRALEDTIIEDDNRKNLDLEYLDFLYKGVIENKENLNKIISQYSSRELENINEIELAVLYYSAFELLNTDLDFKIVINEAILIAKEYGTEDGHTFVNACLDKMNKELKNK